MTAVLIGSGLGLILIGLALIVMRREKPEETGSVCTRKGCKLRMLIRNRNHENCLCLCHIVLKILGPVHKGQSTVDRERRRRNPLRRRRIRG